jgi:hypothetical protein
MNMVSKATTYKMKYTRTKGQSNSSSNLATPNEKMDRAVNSQF